MVFNSSDCGSNYKKAAVIHMDHLEKEDIDKDIQLMYPMPDVVLVVKCYPCGMTNLVLVVDGHRVNTSLLRVIRETEYSGTKIRRVLPLEALKLRDRMRLQTPRELSQKKVWELFSCKHLCERCKQLPENSRCEYCKQPGHDSNFCQHLVVTPLVPEKWRLSEGNKEGRIDILCMQPINCLQAPIALPSSTKTSSCKL